jgi:hypothetical protein
MVRTLLAASVVYCYAHPLFNGLRPATLERPLQFFYAQVNEAASQGRQLLTRFDDARMRAYAQAYMKRVDAQLKQANGSGVLPSR